MPRKPYTFHFAGRLSSLITKDKLSAGIPGSGVIMRRPDRETGRRENYSFTPSRPAFSLTPLSKFRRKK